MLSETQLEELERMEKAATPATEQSMVQDRWIERRAADGQKYSIAEFEHEADQDLYYAMRIHLKDMLAEIRARRADDSDAADGWAYERDDESDDGPATEQAT